MIYPYAARAIAPRNIRRFLSFNHCQSVARLKLFTVYAATTKCPAPGLLLLGMQKVA